MSVRIELSDRQAAALQARAAAQGLSLKEWLERMAAEETETPERKKSAYGLLAKYSPGPSAEEIDENRREMFRRSSEVS